MYTKVAMLAFWCVPCLGQIRTWEREEYKAVAETTWQPGGVTGKFDDAANWNNGIPGAAAGKIGVFHEHQDSVTSGLDQSGAAFSFKIVTTPSYRGNIGASGSPLIMISNAGAKSVTLKGKGTSYIRFDGAFGTDAIVDDGTVFFSTSNGAELLTFMQRGGITTIQATCDCGGIGYVVNDGTQLIIEESDVAESPFNQLIVAGGVVRSERTYTGVSYIIVSGGETIQTGKLDSLTDVIVVSNGVFKYEPLLDPAAETFTLLVPGGVFDARGYEGTLSPGTVIEGPDGVVFGGIIDSPGALVDYDLSQDYP